MLYFSIIYLYFYLLQYQEIEVYNSETTLWIGMLVGGLGIFLFGFNALRLRYFSSESYKILGISISIITVASFMHKQSFDGAFGLMLPIGFCIYEYYQTKKRGL